LSAAPPVRPFEVTHRGVLSIALPMTLAYLTTPLVGVVNLGAVGQLGQPAMVGGVAIGALVFDIAFLSFGFLRAGTTGLVAQAFGAGDDRGVAATLYRAVILAIGIGVALLLLERPIIVVAQALIGGSDTVKAATLEYWRIRVLSAPLALANFAILGWLIGTGRAGFGLLLQVVLNGVNIACSLLFVHWLGLGVAGVGWASVAAETATALAGAGLAYGLRPTGSPPAMVGVLDGTAFRRMVAINRDIMIRTFTLVLAFAVFTARSAKAGDVLLAANEILQNLVVLAAYFLDGMAAAAEQLAGRAIGARHRAAFERAVRLTVSWGLAIGVAAGLVLWLGGPWLVNLMTTNEAVRATARLYLPFAALMPVIGTLAYQMDGVFIGATWSVDMRNLMLVAFAAYLLALWVLEGIFGVTGLWLALLVFLAVRGTTLWWRSRTLVNAEFRDRS
jgi:MATE family multidrug resistance protein